MELLTKLWVWLCLPRVFYVRFNLPFDGFTIGSLVFIKEEYRDDIGLLVHELTHVTQFKRYHVGMLRVYWDRRFRHLIEAQAYHAQHRYNLTHGLDVLPTLAAYLTDNYRLGITYQEALQSILDPETVALRK